MGLASIRAAGLLLVIALLVPGLLGRAGSSSQAAGRSGQEIEALEEADAIEEATEESLYATDNPEGYPDSGGTSKSPATATPPLATAAGGDHYTLDPLPGTGCAETVKTGASLLVTPDPAVLPAGTMSSALSVVNCGANSVDWTAATVPTVTLGSKNATLDAGSPASSLSRSTPTPTNPERSASRSR